MTRWLILVVLLFPLQAWAMLMPYDPDTWVRYVPTIIAGSVIAVEPVADRELGQTSSGHWLLPHAAARIVVSEVLKNSTLPVIAIGDTISLLFPTADSGHNPDQPGTSLWIEDVPTPSFSVGQSGVFALRASNYEWLLGSYHCFRQAAELPEIRTAIHLIETTMGDSIEK